MSPWQCLPRGSDLLFQSLFMTIIPIEVNIYKVFPSLYYPGYLPPPTKTKQTSKQ